MFFRPLSHVEQVAAHLRSLLEQGHWTGEMPGVFMLERELGVNHGVIHRALCVLEQEGILENRGRGKKRRILLGRSTSVGLTIKVMLYEKSDRLQNPYLKLIHLLREAGHDADFADKSLQELGLRVDRLSRFVKKIEADAWVVVSGPKDILEWFSKRPAPTFALFGFVRGLPLAFAAPRKDEAIRSLMGHLFAQGHRRIVQIVREDQRKPQLGWTATLMLEELGKQGIPTGPYNVPDWGDSPAELQRMLDSVFHHTPPTALLIDEAPILLAARDHLAHRGICCPEQVSLACLDWDSAFDWQLPEVTHITWDPRTVLRSIVRWVSQIQRGEVHRRATLVKARLVFGGTIGPAPESTEKTRR